MALDVTDDRKQDWSWKTGSPEKRARMERFIEWCLTPQGQREPSSKAKLARELGVSEQTLRNYQRDPQFLKKVSDEARALARVDRLPDILDSLYVQARDPENPRSVTAARTLMEFMEKATEQEASVDVQSLSDEDLVQVALKLLHRANGESASE